MLLDDKSSIYGTGGRIIMVSEEVTLSLRCLVRQTQQHTAMKMRLHSPDQTPGFPYPHRNTSLYGWSMVRSMDNRQTLYNIISQKYPARVLQRPLGPVIATTEIKQE